MATSAAGARAADHPALLSRGRHQTVRLDRAIADPDELGRALERVLGGSVSSLTVQELDLVNDTTLVDVRFRAPRRGGRNAVAVETPALQGATR